jgi:LCP family protein required for cell wall assembly
MAKKLACLALVVILVSLACSLPNFSDSQAPSPQAISQLLTSGGPDATATATPFQPMGPTATFTPTIALPTSTPDPELAGVPDVGAPIRVNKPLPEGTVNIMVIGNDYRPNSGYRTDVMMLVSINTKKGSVSVISFPRDLYVTIPGWMTQRINTAFAHGGFDMMADTMEYNFGVRPTYYVMTNFQGFIGIINGLGGISVNVGQTLSDTCDLPQARGGYCTVTPGTVNMDGATALWYVRSRHTSSDLDRTRRAQEVLYAIFSKLMSLNAITRLPELYSSYQSAVETNLSVENILPLLPVASQVLGDSSRIHQYSVGAGMVSNYTTPAGAMVLLPDYQAIANMIDEAIFSQ